MMEQQDSDVLTNHMIGFSADGSGAPGMGRKRKPPAKPPQTGARGIVTKSRLRHPDSLHWGCVTFSATSGKIAEDGTVMKLGKMRCFCPRRSHAFRSPKGRLTWCTAERNYGDGSFETKAEAVRWLKSWAIAGLSVDVKTMAQHKELSKDFPMLNDADADRHKPQSDRDLSPSGDEKTARPRRATNKTRLTAAASSSAGPAAAVRAPGVPAPGSGAPRLASSTSSSGSKSSDSSKSSGSKSSGSASSSD